jgi:hypothetical protein
MERLIIKNIGPIKNVDITLNKINVFIGAQSSGKSTISKILCHCQWIEKTCYLNDNELNNYEKKGEFYDSLVKYHRLEGYFNKTASIKYIGTSLTITYTHSSKRITIKKTENTTYSYPKISYIPSERNLVAAISNFSKYNETNDVILHFGYDWTDAKNAIPQIDLSKVLERNISYEYRNGIDYIKDGEAEILLKFASSGILSMLPLYLTTSYMCDELYKITRGISSEKRTIAKKLSLKAEDVFNYKYSQLFIEEPEQNLFPEAQKKLVYNILNLNNNNTDHRLSITTHSPYILYALNNCILGGLVKDKMSVDELNEIAIKDSFIDPKKISVFQIADGEINNIQNEDGLIGENFFDNIMKELMDDYYELIEYYGEDE